MTATPAATGRKQQRRLKMTKTEFRQQISDLLNQTLDDGPGPRWVALMTACALTKFIMNEAGANTPAAVNEIVERMQKSVELAAAE
jgi:hypothetical protein